ncbi:tyrosine-type recombinase/integrase [Microvirga massiliensis]|uniref:tyrosine-type recombinase/integrase n=1 Tax=Microvirga massiliensis TaxID=1033741 RepID=UPI00065FA177|nr:site-specific integrase [Microvirga massiliensis]
MPKLRLTAAAVDRFQPPAKGQVEYYDAHLPAFGLRVSYSGAKAWFVMTRINGKLTRLTLGRYPALSLAEAREKARQVIENAKAGGDPRRLEAEERRRKAKEQQTTFRGTAALFMERYVERELRPNTAREYRRILQGSDTAAWRDRPISSISKDDVVDLLHRIEERGSPAAANRALAYLGKFFNWSLEQDLITVSPTAKVRALSSGKSRERVLTPEELAWLWCTLNGYPGLFGGLFKVLLLTGQRRSEVAGMRWDELRSLNTSEAVWHLPPERTKNAQSHLVPLAPAVRTILQMLPRTGPLVFSTTSKTAVSGFSKAKRQLDLRIAQLRSDEHLASLLPWTLHDLRRTMVTTMNERLSVPPHVVEAVVNHISGPAKRGVAGVYNRAIYLNERRNALNHWADYVTRLVCDNHASDSMALQFAQGLAQQEQIPSRPARLIAAMPEVHLQS